MSAQPYALVIGPDEAAREECCRELTRAGYLTIGFDDCSDALEWLDEETPSVAVIRAMPEETCSPLRSTLHRRGVDVR